VVAQHLGKQVVVAVPTSLVIQRDDKQVRPLEHFQHGLAPLLTRHRIAERSAQALQETGAQQKRLHRLRLPREHLFREVVEHIAMAAGEGREKLRDIRSALQRERGQLQAGNPAFRATLEDGNGFGGQVQPHHSLQKGVHFGGFKAQVTSPDLAELPLCPQPGQWEWGVGAGGQDEV